MIMFFDKPVMISINSDNESYRLVPGAEFSKILDAYLQANSHDELYILGSFISQLKIKKYGNEINYVHDHRSSHLQEHLLNSLKKADVVMTFDLIKK